MTLEGPGRRLDPDFDMANQAATFLRNIKLSSFTPQALARRGLRNFGQALGVV